MTLRTSHQVAFAEWYVANLDRLATLWREPVYGDADVKLTLNRYYLCLVASIARDRCAVELQWDLQQWAVLFAADIAVQRHDSLSYECALRPAGDRLQTPRIADLWEAHLYEPLADWIEQTVSVKPMLHICERGTTRWARFQYRETTPTDVLVTLHGGSEPDGGRRCFVSGEWG